MKLMYNWAVIAEIFMLEYLTVFSSGMLSYELAGRSTREYPTCFCREAVMRFSLKTVVLWNWDYELVSQGGW